MVEIPSNKVGDRILIKQKNGLIPATVRFRGSLEDKNGEWVGIEYDEPYGKHDGSHNGTRCVKNRLKRCEDKNFEKAKSMLRSLKIRNFRLFLTPKFFQLRL